MEVALKIACQWWVNRGEPRHQIVAFDGAYHGDTFGAMAVGERNLFSEPFDEQALPRRPAVPGQPPGGRTPEVDAKEQAALAVLAQTLQHPDRCRDPRAPAAGGGRDGDGAAAASAGQRRRWCGNAGTLLIADEVLIRLRAMRRLVRLASGPGSSRI